MAVDDTRLAFSSNWDIDLIYAQGVITAAGSVAAGASIDLILFIHNIGFVPVFDMFFQSAPGANWQQNGEGNNATVMTYMAYATSTALHLIAGSGALSGTTNFTTSVYYYVWTDTVIY